MYIGIINAYVACTDVMKYEIKHHFIIENPNYIFNLYYIDQDNSY